LISVCPHFQAGFGIRVAEWILLLLDLTRYVPIMPATRQEAAMGSIRRSFHTALLFIGFTSCALAEDGKPDRSAPGTATAMRPALTGKERLGPKWTDEQRLDNCHVPVDKRGTRPRPSACPNLPSS
jgi:hypothetical protein